MMALAAMAMLLATALVMSKCGLKDSFLLVVIVTGAVGVANSIAGIKPAPAPGTTTLVNTPDPNVKPEA